MTTTRPVWPNAETLLPLASADKAQIGMIAAYSQDRSIGLKNQLLWRLPADLQQFKAATAGCTVLMGRKTWESLAKPGESPKPLPNRLNLVLSRQAQTAKSSSLDGVQFVQDLATAIQLAEKNTHGRLWIIGGGEIYQQMLDQVSVLRVTEVDANLQGDTFFPPLDYEFWEAVDRQYHPVDERNPYVFTCVTYHRKRAT